MGVYDHPAPAGSEIRSVPITEDAGSFVLLAARGMQSLTRLRDRLEAALPFDLPGV
jgi:hypothetical protein